MKKWGFRNESPNKKESPIIRQDTINWFEGGMVDHTAVTTAYEKILPKPCIALH